MAAHEHHDTSADVAHDAAPDRRAARGALHTADARAVAGMREVVSVHPNDSRWWQNASFALPLLGAVLSLAAGAFFRSAEATGFGLFLGAVTLIMLPVVLLTWRSTATSVVLTREGAASLHRGRVLHDLRWSDLQRVERVEYLGNVRHKLVHADDRFMSIESEIEGADRLVDLAFELSGIERQQPRAAAADSAEAPPGASR